MRILRDQLRPGVEILIEPDGGEASIGRKRNALLARATGDYVAFIDDDDTVAPDYLDQLFTGIGLGVDCVSIRGRFSENGVDLGEFIDLPYQGHCISQLAGKQTFLRGVQHLDAIRRELALTQTFPDSSYTEDYAWGTALERSRVVRTWHQVPHAIYFYDYWNNKPDSRYVCNLAIVMPVLNHVYTTMRSVESLLQATTDPNFRLILVDDGSTRESEVADYASELARRLDYRFQYVHNQQTLGVNPSWNVGIAAARAFAASYIAVVNNDVLFAPGWDTPLVAALADPGVGIVSPLSTYGSLQLDWPRGALRDVNPAGYRGYMPLLGACFVGRADTFARVEALSQSLGHVGTFPEAMRIYFGDNWLAAACQHLGLACGYDDQSYVHHLFCITTSQLNNPPLFEADGAVFTELESRLGRHMEPFAPPPDHIPPIRPNSPVAHAGTSDEIAARMEVADAVASA